MPAPEKIQEFARKYLNGTITAAEEKELNEWYNAQPADAVEWLSHETEAALKERMFSDIQQQKTETGAPVTIMPKRRKRWHMPAAAATLVLGLASSYFIFKTPSKKPAVAQVQQINNSKAGMYNRYLQLPDGSTVVLHANSTLEYPKTFSGNKREVTLNGEAYFDIAHNAAQPFIIHTGKIKTTVLGTAFNIAAYPNSKSIIVSVERGKVKVEDDQKLLAVLTPAQQITYNIPTEDAKQEVVDAAYTVNKWVKQDMSFDGASFASIAELLSKRFDVEIRFKNPALKKCTIKVSFNGTEPLEKVLDVLSIINNVSYTREDNNVFVIDGEGCM